MTHRSLLFARRCLPMILALLSGAVHSASSTDAASPADPSAVGATAPAKWSANGAAPPGLPRWEWGIGLGAAWLRDYPGSAHRGAWALPLPWFIWRSERIEVGREGGRGTLYRTPDFEIDLTLAANPPSSVGDNPERAGMADLDALLEPGLRARWRFALDDAGRWSADLRLPVRQAISIAGDWRTHGVGLRIEPSVSLDWRPARGWSLGGWLGIGFAEQDYNAFYYSVPATDATPWRSAYRAPGGYTGWQTGMRAGWRGGKLSASVFTRIENVGEAAFADSPLVRTDWGHTLGIAVNWRLGESRHRIGHASGP